MTVGSYTLVPKARYTEYVGRKTFSLIEGVKTIHIYKISLPSLVEVGIIRPRVEWS